ncbi:MAG: GNAT family N-acetyltransferase [Oscillospiraceae bacterium]|nr:GNAT family N-acetyltransferase [Oscillospiraceae bacterium]
MTNKQYADAITRGHFLYWDMLGNLRGNENRKEDGLRWMTGDIFYTYYAQTSDAEGIVRRMKDGEIPKNLILLTDDLEADPSVPFLATGLFKTGLGTTGMAHELMDTPLPKADKRLNIFRVREVSQLKTAGAIINAAFEYSLFSFAHYAEMMENEGQFFYLAEFDGLPAGACMSQHGDDYVNISWVGTLPGNRKRGIAGYLIQAAEREGMRHGKTTGVLHGRPCAVNAYRRIGYKDICRTIDLELCLEEEKEHG